MKILDFSQAQYKHSNFVIPYWYGRFGNNVLQIANALVLADVFDGSVHSPLSHDQIHSFTTSNFYGNCVIDKFFSSDTGIHLIEDTELNSRDRDIWSKKLKNYIQYVLKEKLKFSIEGPIISENTLVIHLRGEDIFTSNQVTYTQCPLSHILKVSEKYEKVIVVFQDRMNPIVSVLEKLPKFQMQSSSIESDFSTLYRASHLLLGGCSSFSEIASIESTHKKLIYTSDANRFNQIIRMNCATIHLTLPQSYCGGKMNWNRDTHQMMEYIVSEIDYNKHEKIA